MINRIVLVGRITADPEIRYTKSEMPVCNFCIAVERTFKNASGEKETDFINIVAWRKLAELVDKYTSKGKMVCVDGSLQMRKYQTREGENRTTYEVHADNIQFLSYSNNSNNSESNNTPPSNENDDELPF